MDLADSERIIPAGSGPSPRRDDGALIFTSFGTILFLDEGTGRLRHGLFEATPHNVVGVRRGGRFQLLAGLDEAQSGVEITADGGLARAGSDAAQVAFDVLGLRRGEFGLTLGGVYLSAQPCGQLVLDRPVCSDWEAFHLSPSYDEHSGAIVSQRIDGHLIRFFITNRRDEIQRYQCRGDFYEREDLEVIRNHCRPETTAVDIGSNIGNHAIFLSKICNVSRIIAFEPNPDAIRMLNINLALNRCDNVDLKHLGFALGSSSGAGRIDRREQDNLGGAQVVADRGGGVPILAGDDVLFDEPVGFLKIDVEGMEFDVLAGLRRTIQRWRPNLFIEVWPAKRKLIDAWAREAGYQVAWSAGYNLMLLPA